MVCRTEAISKIAEIALNCIGNSTSFEGFGLRGFLKITRATAGLLQDYGRCLREALLAILAVVSQVYQDLCPQTVLAL